MDKFSKQIFFTILAGVYAGFQFKALYVMFSFLAWRDIGENEYQVLLFVYILVCILAAWLLIKFIESNHEIRKWMLGAFIIALIGVSIFSFRSYCHDRADLVRFNLDHSVVPICELFVSKSSFNFRTY